MLPEPLRCRHRQWFSLAQQQPKLKANRQFALVGIPKTVANDASLPVSSPSEPPRLGIIISRKVAKNAVVRNKRRRQCHEIYRWQIVPSLLAVNEHALHDMAGLILIVRQQAVATDFDQLSQSFHHVCQLPRLETSLTTAC